MTSLMACRSRGGNAGKNNHQDQGFAVRLDRENEWQGLEALRKGAGKDEWPRGSRSQKAL